MEQSKETESPSPIVELYDRLVHNDPKLITNFVPEDATEQKEAFLVGAIRSPHHTYARLDALNFAEADRAINEAGQAILSLPELDRKYAPVYEEFTARYSQMNRMRELAHAYNHTLDQTEKKHFGAEYMALNVELYGAPDETTYRSLLNEKLAHISQKELTGEAAQMRSELFGMVEYDGNTEAIERFKPSLETIAWMHSVAEALYGGMLAHIPEQEKFSAQEVQKIFTEVITEEFDDAASDWTVAIEPAKAINIKATEKRVVIPEDRGDISREQLQGLVVHELGVHFLRSLMGAQTDLLPFQHGLSEYYDAEEGLGVVMEQAVKGEFRESGVDHYLTAGLAYHDQKDFRDTYEIKRRIEVLSKIDHTDTLDAVVITKANSDAYGNTMRSFRGTDELPWFKDLAYYNGAVNMWRYLESIRGDDTKFMFVLLGKANPANIAHERIMYETKSPVKETAK